MSLMKMRRTMASKNFSTIILWVVIGVFLLGVFFWNMPSKQPGAGDDGRFATTPVAVVNGQTITEADLDRAYYEQTRLSGDPSIEMALTMRQRIFDEKVQNVLLEQQLKQRGIKTNDGAIKKIAEEYADAQVVDFRRTADEQFTQQQEELKKKETAPKETTAPKDAADADKDDDTQDETKENKKPKTRDEFFTEQIKSYFDSAQQKNRKPTEKEFRKYFVREFLMNKKSDVHAGFAAHARMRLLGDAILKSDFSHLPINDEYAKAISTQEVKASWIVRFADSMTPDALQAAQKKVQETYAKVKKDPTSFAKLAGTESDDFMTASNGGDLGWLQAPNQNTSILVEYLAFSTAPGTMSPVALVTQSLGESMVRVGYGFVRVDKMRPRADAKDLVWETARESAILRAKQRYSGDIVRVYLEMYKYTAKITAKSPEISAYLAMKQGKYTEVAKHFEQAAVDANLPPAVSAAIKFQLAMQAPNVERRIELLEGAISYAGKNTVQVTLMLGQAYAEAKRRDEALEQFSMVFTSASTSNDFQTMRSLLDEYKKLNDTDGIAAVKQWLATHKEAPPQNGGMPMGMPMGQ